MGAHLIPEGDERVLELGFTRMASLEHRERGAHGAVLILCLVRHRDAARHDVPQRGVHELLLDRGVRGERIDEPMGEREAIVPSRGEVVEDPFDRAVLSGEDVGEVARRFRVDARKAMRRLVRRSDDDRI
jgi:hypothetical protein